MRSPRWLTGVDRRIGYRGAVLLFLAELDLVYGFVLAFPSPASRAWAVHQYLCGIMPLRAWAVLWIVVAGICAYHAFQHFDRFGFIAAIAIKMLWGSLALIGVLLADVSLAWPAIWLSLAGLVWRVSAWPEPRPVVHLDGGGQDAP